MDNLKQTDGIFVRILQQETTFYRLFFPEMHRKFIFFQLK
jgi:hypothetical protein